MIRYRSFAKTHLQRSYSEDELTCALSKAGFAVIRSYDAFTRDPVRADSERIQYLAIKEEA